MFRLISFSCLLLLQACAVQPSSPAVLVLPGQNKTLVQFQADEGLCRQVAFEYTEALKIKPASYELGQRQYDFAYLQCMYEKGHRVPLPNNLRYDDLSGTGLKKTQINESVKPATNGLQ